MHKMPMAAVMVPVKMKGMEVTFTHRPKTMEFDGVKPIVFC